MHCRLGFLLVAAFPWHHHLLALAALSARSSSSSEDTSTASSSSSSSVAWSSPAPGDRFGPGDAIVGKWQVTAGSKVVSPSFRLCAGGQDGCGSTVWPEVVEESPGSYHASLTAPNVSTESAYYLQMKDDFGDTFSSPIFNLALTPQVKAKPAESSPEVAQPRPDQVPMSSSSSSGPKSKGGTNSDPAAPAAAGPADPGGTLSPPSAAGVPANAVASWTPGSGGGEPLVAVGRGAPPTVALAVPLSLAGAIVLLAGGLALHHRRQLAEEKKERCYPPRQDGLSSAQVAAATAAAASEPEASKGRMPSLGLALDLGGRRRSGSGRNDDHDHDDVEKALFARTALGGRFPHPHPDLDPAYEHAYYAPSCAYSAPERRQRTRRLDLDLDRDRDLLSREVHTRRPRARANPSCSSLSSHASPHRGLCGNNRYGVRRSTASKNIINGGGGGSGSLWRSLSIARRKPPPALASPALTESVASVTSEVLPSYLPSPNFAGVAGQMRGPLPPPPLHTRGEATEPDDLRMKELRGVYEAVARALGTVRGV
ncbi:hypothetical protein BC827DRAFT_947576 [Russula dissimulans]|nr:hypothetical protein BC827DRAFT_947576 [Russula dissimulans]